MHRISFITVLLLIMAVSFLWRNNVRLRNERDRFQSNTEALLSEMKQMRIDSATVAIDVKALRLNIDEYKRLRAEDASKIKAMGIKIRNLEAVAKHEIEVAGPINAAIKDTIILNDTIPAVLQKVEMITPHIQLTGVIKDSRLQGEIRVRVTLRQAVWFEYKRHWIFWKRIKAVHQTISSDNPYVQIQYSEYIAINNYGMH